MNSSTHLNGSCHCGTVRFNLKLPNGLDSLSRCNCSMCRRRGAIVISVPLSSLCISQGEENLSLYQFNTKTAKHYFCRTCGIYTHHQRRSNPQEFAVNVGCLEGIDSFNLGEIVTTDGVNHSCDRKGTRANGEY